MISRLTLVAMSLLVAFGAVAATTNKLSDAEIAGRKLVQQILELRLTENVTNTGVLKIRPKKQKQTEIPVTFKVVVTPTNWQSVYEIVWTNNWMKRDALVENQKLSITHSQTQPNKFKRESYFLGSAVPTQRTNDSSNMAIGEAFGIQPGTISWPAGEELMRPFAGSDFWIADLGLEFFHWPQQKVLKKEFRNHCGCMVLESANPNPTTNGYSRVVTWIDEESLGVVQAEAYDSQNKKLKEFYPKAIKKVNGQWQVQTMQIINVQTESRTQLEFDLDTK